MADDSINNLAKQARQGSIAAIIQFLNEGLADCGVRTRALIEEGMLQLLCEAEKAEQLEQAPLVERIRQILEPVAPRKMRRVRINSRIVQEQQLLWLDEINRHPEELLWAEEILLKKPNFFKQIFEDLKANTDRPYQPSLPKFSSLKEERQKLFWRGLLGGAGSILLLLLVGWPISKLLISRTTTTAENQPVESASPQPSAQSGSGAIAGTETAVPANAVESADPFVTAVRLAEQASADGKVAQSSAQWLDLAAKWQQASDLMSKVPPQDERYETAQDRKGRYQKNSEYAQEQAQISRVRAKPTIESLSN